jgi:uncharacterized protein (DUF433 family)
VEPIEIYDRGRGPELKRIRITVYDIIPYLEEDYHPSHIATILPISTAEVMALVKYIEAHKEEVMAVHGRIEARMRRGNPPEIEERLCKSPHHARLLGLLAKDLEQIEREEADAAPAFAFNI